ncbi:hypothetical protein Pla108_18230 [Botrimarina colliarenosi]|uniref:Beta-mannosidase-like galactose-binding domain-containing protein n=1 Tax=Botrimarina colliarenosi TaxID=2528001 RepID=A0A5C6AF30_9BACT|nr:glycosyl hydrolase [Botrimarina colliarenosi]TWT97671.1 hypothetical protein Pla108_18230 [Botrimarina colliarenosi]
MLSLLAACVPSAIGIATPAQSISELERRFDSPPEDARPWVFWYWLKGRVSAEGITADLEAMREAGLGGAYLMPIQGPDDPPAFEPPATQLSPRFWRMVRHAAREADRLGLRLGMHLCDGFATAGGPWVTPELSMQQLVWSQTRVTGGAGRRLDLPQPETHEDYYRDIATLALPCPAGYGIDTSTSKPKVATSDNEPDADRLARADNAKRYRSDRPCWIRYDFDEPFTARSVTVTPDGSNYQCQRLLIEASDDGVDWRMVAQLDAPRHGWQDEGRPVTHALSETTARSFRFSWTPVGSEPGGEDLDSAKWAAVLKVQSIVLSSEACLHQHRGKNGSVWRKSPPTTASQAPERLCTPVAKVIDVSRHVDAAGRLNWDAPPGEWLVMRFGHTSTGKRNATAGGGIGLECDKLSDRAVRLQYDHWFGEARRQIADEIGDTAMRRVLGTLHLDSWECGAQNWTPDFAAEFAQRHGEDLKRWLPAMAGLPIESAGASERFLWNVRATIADLVAERFYGGLRQIADEEGLRFTGECTAPTMPGDGMRHFAYLDAPMGEFWLNSPTHDKPTDLRDAISAAHRYGKQVVQAEAFTQLRIGWDETPASLKPLGDRVLAEGVNRLVFHVWTHNPWLDRKPGQTLGGVGLYFQRDQPWIAGARGWVEYLARCQAVLQAGEPVVDIAVSTGDDYPRRALTPDKLVDRAPGLMGKEAVDRQRQRLANEGQPQREMPAGVRASANLPDSEAWTDPLRGYKYDSIANHAGSAVTKRYALVLDAGAPAWTEPDLASRGVARDFRASDDQGGPAEGFAWTHRAGDGWDAYFVSNQRDESRGVRLSFRATGSAMEVWDPNTGLRRRIAYSAGARTECLADFAAGQSLLFVIRQQSNADRTGPLTELKPINGSWSLSLNALVGPKRDARTIDSLRDLAETPDFADFVGEAIYATDFRLGDLPPEGSRAWLDVGRASALAAVRLNGVDCGVAWTAPWRVDVTDALRVGDNELSVTTPSVWKNALVADLAKPEAERVTWTSAPVRLSKSAPAPLGLFGPVRLLIETPEP